MYELYTGHARRIVIHAEAVAGSRGRVSAGTGELLIAVLEVDSFAHQVLAACGTPVASLIDALPDPGEEEDEVVGGYGIPMNRLANSVLHLSLEEASGIDDQYVGGQHLLLGLLREPDGVGGRFLRNAGLDLAVVRIHAAGPKGH